MVTTELGRGVLALIGEMEGNKVTVKSGRFGTYINWKKVNAKMPQEYADDPSTLPLDVAWSLIEEKGGSASGKGAKSKSGKKGETGSLNLPPAPKRPPSGYLHFCTAKRPELTEEIKSLGAISKELARLWAEASDEDRAPFMALATASKDKYDDDKIKWQAACQEQVSARTTSPKRVKGSTATKTTTTRSSGRASSSSSSASASPKRPKSAYLYFCAKHRPLVAPELNKLGDISKELARLWSDVSDADRVIYEEQAAADKLRYETERLGQTAAPMSVRKSSSGRTTTLQKKVTSTKSTGRGPSAYMLFCAEYRHTMVDQNGMKLSFGDTTKGLAQRWKECGEEERARFVAEAERQKKVLAL
jgi:phage host-nuclease inhibitor protein Gam